MIAERKPDTPIPMAMTGNMLFSLECYGTYTTVAADLGVLDGMSGAQDAAALQRVEHIS